MLGKVRSIRETTYTPSSIKNQNSKSSIQNSYIREKKTSRVVNMDLHEKYTIYNLRGKELESYAYDRQGKLLEKWITNYEKGGGQIRRSCFDPQGIIQKDIITTFDHNKNSVESIELISGDTTRSTNKYDDKNNLVEEVSIRQYKGKVFTSKSKYRYFSGKKVESELYNGEDKLNLRIVYKYHDNGKIAATYMYKTGESSWHSKHEFDKNGNEVERIFIDSKQSKTNTWRLEYKFDSKGNWIERVEYKNNLPIYKSYREIEYYSIKNIVGNWIN